MNKKIFKAIVSIIVIISLSLLPGCLLPPGETPPKTSPTVAPTTPAVTTPAPTSTQPGWTPPPVQSGTPSSTFDMVSVVTKVRPSVVAIDVEVTGVDIFNRPITQSGAGSGWIIDASGFIVTNNHVVEDATTITVTLSDGRTFEASKVSTDPLADLAVIKIDATGLTAAKVGDSSKLQVGMLVAAIGNALGRGISMTGGWVSRLGVNISADAGQTLYDLIETDAAINPGNSGGPLVNTAGEVIGITSAKLVDVNVEGVGYAIAINTAMPIIQDLITKGYVVRPYFGISVQTVTLPIAQSLNLPVNKGAVISRVVSGSPAAAGLRENDVIVAIGSKEINNADDLVLAIRGSQIGQKVRVTFWRGNTKSEIDVTPAEMPR